MSTTEIAARIRSYLDNEVGLDTVAIESTNQKLFTDGHLSSMDILNLVLFIEGEFGIRVNSLDISVENFDCVNTMADYASRKIGA